MTYHIERFYDKFTKSWVAMLKDEEGNQVADAIYVYSKLEIQKITEEDFTVYSHLKESYSSLKNSGKQLLVCAKGLSITQLIANTEQVLGVATYRASTANYGFEHVKKNVMPGLKYISYDASVFSKDSKKHYNTSIFFYNVAEGTIPTLDKNPARVSCSCPAYYFYFSYWNRVEGCHARRPLRPYVRKTDDLPERNGLHLPGLCKHLIAFADYLNNEDYMLGNVAPAKAYKPFDKDPVKADKGYKSLSKDELEKKLKSLEKKPVEEPADESGDEQI